MGIEVDLCSMSGEANTHTENPATATATELNQEQIRISLERFTILIGLPAAPALSMVSLYLVDEQQLQEDLVGLSSMKTKSSLPIHHRNL